MLRTTRIVVISILLSLTALSACTPRRVGEAMNRADSLMTSAPDSALALLDAIDPATLRTDAARARHALLLSQALDKNYVDVTDDSLISIADDYYARTSDTRSQMLSLFYHGRVAYNAKDYPRALVLFTRSLDLARTLDDPFWSARNAGEMSEIFEKTFHPKEELHYAVMAGEYFEKTDNYPFVNHSNLVLARASLNNDLYGQAKRYAALASDSAMKHGDYDLWIDSRIIEAKAAFYLAEFPETIDILESLFADNGGDVPLTAYEHLGMAYLKAGRTDKASEFANYIPDSLRPKILIFYFEEAKSRKDYRRASEILETIAYANNDTLSNALNYNFSQVLTEHLFYTNRIHDLENENHLMWGCILIAVSAIILIMGISHIRRLRGRQRQLLERNLAIAQNLEEVLSLRSDLQSDLKDMLLSRDSEIDSLCRTFYENQNAPSLKTAISREIDGLVYDLSDNPDYMATLQRMANDNFEDIYTRFLNDMPGLKDADYKLFLYSLLGFSIPAIALLLREEKVNSVYNRKARLKRKLKGLPQDKATEYLAILN